MGDLVWVSTAASLGWKPGRVKKPTGPLSYIVEIDGVDHRRHADHLRLRHVDKGEDSGNEDDNNFKFDPNQFQLPAKNFEPGENGSIADNTSDSTTPVIDLQQPIQPEQHSAPAPAATVEAAPKAAPTVKHSSAGGSKQTRPTTTEVTTARNVDIHNEIANHPIDILQSKDAANTPAILVGVICDVIAQYAH